MQKKFLVFAALLFAFVIFIFCFFLGTSPHLIPKNTVRILIDRMPAPFSTRQNLDYQGKRIWPLLEEQHYSLIDFTPNIGFTLKPADPRKPNLSFICIKDEVSLALYFLSGKADVIYDALSIAKTEWLKRQSSTQVFEHPGLGLSYLGFNHQNPILSHLPVRRAIALALPVDRWVQNKLFNWATSVKLPGLGEVNLDEANRLLEEAGYKIQKNGFRFQLHYYTTPVREGNETALLVREALKAIHIRVKIAILENSLFYQKIRKGDFDLFSSKWIRFDAQEPISDLLGQAGSRNYTHFYSEQLEALILKKPSLDFQEASSFIAEQLPLFPLYAWKHGLILSSRVIAPLTISTSLDETFRFLSLLELK